MPEMTYNEAIESSIAQEMRRDETVFCMATSPPAALAKEFGTARVRRTPIAESAMSGIGVGAAASGFRPIVFLWGVTFAFSAMDQLVNQAASMRYMFGGQARVPAVFRARYNHGTNSAAQHSQTGYAIFAHAGGLKIVTPSSPLEAHGLMKAAIRSDDPVFCIESMRLETVLEEIPEEVDPLPIGQAAIAKGGEDLTIVGLGYTTKLALDAANRLQESGHSAEVVDLRSVVPLDIETVRRSVRKTGRLLVVDESNPMCSVASEILAGVAEDSLTLSALRHSPKRVCNAPVPIPYSPPLEGAVLPDESDVVTAAVEVLEAKA